MTTVQFIVDGLSPQAKGSKTLRKTKDGRQFLAEAAPKLKPWMRMIIKEAAAMQAEVGTLDGPLMVVAEFRFPIAQARRGLRRCWKTSAPDLDKLVRALGDALTQSKLIHDDARICALNVWKVETDQWPGVIVTVRTLDDRSPPKVSQQLDNLSSSTNQGDK